MRADRSRSNPDDQRLTVTLLSPSADDMFLPPDPRSYPSGFDEPFGEVGLIDATPPDQIVPESASIERDNKLLSFHPSTQTYPLLDYSLRPASVSLAAQLHGMFFMAESPSAVAADPNMSAAELTCYRRNLFQITGSITLPRGLRCLLTDHGDRIPIVAQELSISATESVEGHPVKLISVPWKTPAANATVSPDDKTEKEPTSIPLDILSNPEVDGDYANFPIAWKRLQFRIATANNGRRKELQQHFVVRLRVMATLATGTKVSICEATSGAIIVRGRSPRNFQTKTNYPVGMAANGSKKSMHAPAAHRKPSGDPIPHVSPVKSEAIPEQAFPSFNFHQRDSHSPTKFTSWHPPAAPAASLSSSHVPAPRTPTYPVSASPAGSSRTYRRSGSSSTSPPAKAVALSPLDDTEANRQRSRTHKAARKSVSTSTRPMPYQHPSFPSPTAYFHPHPPVHMPDGLDSADVLYEYLPFGITDLMAPVDAMYRPHGMHQVNLAPSASVGDPGGFPGRSKRYFDEDHV